MSRQAGLSDSCSIGVQNRRFRRMLMTLNVFTFLILSALPSQGADVLCEVISVQSNAWRTQPGSSVRSSLRVGDTLRKGDYIEVMRGNTLDLAFDKERLNVLRIDGGTSIEISDLFPTSLEMTKGKVYAQLDNKGSDRRFKVLTPTAIAAVRGTRFQVAISDLGSQITTFQGLVQVSGRNPSTHYETKDFILLKANQKTSVKASGQIAEPLPIADNELREISSVQGQIETIKSTLIATPSAASGQAPSQTSSSRLVQSKSSDENRDKPKEGKVIL